jgi:DNA-binding MarR family transcriptional regulator
MAYQETSVTPPDRIQWLSDLIRLEIELWNRIDNQLRQAHNLSLAFFEALYFIARSRDGSLRVGDLAGALRITQGATSKLVDRVEAAGLIRRALDADDRRVCWIMLTDDGRRMLTDASRTYEAELASALDATLSLDEQQHLHDLVTRLLATPKDGGPE